MCAQSCLTVWDPGDHNPPSSSVHGILQAKTLECLPPEDLPDAEIKPVSLASPALARRFFTTSATWEVYFFFDKFLLKNSGFTMLC